MARMIPELNPDTIENLGERLFYEAAYNLPDTYTVLYGYKYFQHLHNELVREVDFIIIHPTHGFLVIEVKQGEAAYYAGQWHEMKLGGYLPLHKDPIEQARTAMYHILHLYRSDNRNQDFSLGAKYVVCFPECTRIAGKLPAELHTESIWTKQDVDQLHKKISRLLPNQDRDGSNQITDSLIRSLAPSFKLFTSLSDQIEAFHNTSHRILTEEQERIIEETLEDKRKLFLGSAGTGKTFIAIEKARRSTQEGKRVFLTCFNKNLVGLIAKQAGNIPITISNFHNYLEQVLKEKNVWKPAESEDVSHYYDIELPEQGFYFFANASEDEKFDCILIDEGQDFKEDWIACLENMLRPDGELYIFADPNQNIFGTPEDWRKLQKFTISTHRLTQNMRNTQKINDWLGPLIGGSKIKSRMEGGLPVTTWTWMDSTEQKKQVEKEIGRLVSQGVPPNRITILSPYRRENGCLNGVDRIKEWPLVDLGSGESGITYATIRAFKGLEADILFLVDIKPGSRVSSGADVYVGASRARFMLYVFHVDWHDYDNN